MRSLVSLSFSLLAVACSGAPAPVASAGSDHAASPEPAPPESLRQTCRDLDSPDLDVRIAAKNTLLPHVGPREGGTEQQMEASGAFCEAKFAIRPAWMPADD